MGFPRQEYWSGLPFPSPGDLPNPGIKPGSSAWSQILYLLRYEGIPCICIRCFKPDRQCASSACIGCQKGLSVLGKQRGTHQKRSKAESTPEGVGRSVAKVFVRCHIAQRAKWKTGREVVCNSSPNPTPQEAKVWVIFSFGSLKLGAGAFLCFEWKSELVQPP